jgi:hypothetical protein
MSTPCATAFGMNVLARHTGAKVRHYTYSIPTIKLNIMNNTLNTLFYKSLFISCLFFVLTSAAHAQQQERIRIIFGTRVHPSADGKGCEGEKGICLIFTTTDIKGRSSDMGEAQLDESNGRIVLNILKDPDPALDYENTFYVYEDKRLPSDVASAFGYREIVLKKGEYRIDKSDNPLGKVTVDAIFEF